MKRKALRDLSFAEAATEAVRLGLEPQDDKTVNKKLGIIQQAFKYIVFEHDQPSRNPFEGVLLELESNAIGEKDPFTLSDLKAIFRSPPFTGAKSETNWTTPGNVVLRQSEKFWLPLLGLWTGARLNELCQLTTAHVRQHGKAHYIALTSDLRLKNKASVRNVPLHSALVELGFLEFVAGCKEGERLFPNLPQHKTGRYSDAAGKMFNRLLDSLGIKRPKMDFHSFRHTFSDACERSDVDLSRSRESLDTPSRGRRGGTAKTTPPSNGTWRCFCAGTANCRSLNSLVWT